VRGTAARCALLALVVRLGVVALAAGRVPPVDDATYYQVVAERIARGLGYTWAWPDGTVTFAANYPVGYPALLGGLYVLSGPRPVVAMILNALVGAAATFATVCLASRAAPRRAALVSGVVVALEPALVFYTPALMTEAFAGELAVIAAAIVTAARPGSVARAAAAGAVCGVATLVRPELVLFAPFVGALCHFRAPDWRRSALGALGVTSIAFAVCLPWTLRNCARLDRCAFVSANAGQNLLIGTSSLGKGGWVGLDRVGVPVECRTEFGEGGKDRCFGDAARRLIRADPLAWLRLVPSKLGMTFDYGTAAAYYLSTSNPSLIGERVKVTIGALELLGQRVVLVLAAAALARVPGARVRARRVVGVAAAVLSLCPPAWLAFLLLVVEGALAGRALVRSPAAWLAVAAVALTALTHAVFFGAGRYALVCLPALAALSGMAWPARKD
jgi:hypothetical protein